MKKISIIIHWLLLVASIIGGLYVGGWVMFIQPILEACKHFDTGTLTGAMIGTTVLKCIFASGVGGVIIYIGTIVSTFIAAIVETISNKSKSKKGE